MQDGREIEEAKGCSEEAAKTSNTGLNRVGADKEAFAQVSEWMAKSSITTKAYTTSFASLMTSG